MTDRIPMTDYSADDWHGRLYSRLGWQNWDDRVPWMRWCPLRWGITWKITDAYGWPIRPTLTLFRRHGDPVLSIPLPSSWPTPIPAVLAAQAARTTLPAEPEFHWDAEAGPHWDAQAETDDRGWTECPWCTGDGAPIIGTFDPVEYECLACRRTYTADQITRRSARAVAPIRWVNVRQAQRDAAGQGTVCACCDTEFPAELMTLSQSGFRIHIDHVTDRDKAGQFGGRQVPPWAGEPLFAWADDDDPLFVGPAAPLKCCDDELMKAWPNHTADTDGFTFWWHCDGCGHHEPGDDVLIDLCADCGQHAGRGVGLCIRCATNRADRLEAEVFALLDAENNPPAEVMNGDRDYDEWLSETADPELTAAVNAADRAYSRFTIRYQAALIGTRHAYTDRDTIAEALGDIDDQADQQADEWKDAPF